MLKDCNITMNKTSNISPTVASEVLMFTKTFSLIAFNA